MNTATEVVPGDFPFQFVAHQRALDFVNTERMEAGTRLDLLEDFESLIQWLVEAGVLGEQASPSLLRQFADKNLRATAMKEARCLRSAIRSLAESGATGRDVPNAILNEINRVLREARTYREVVRTSVGFASNYCSEWNTPLQLLAPVAEAAADLLVHGDLRLIKKCENPECILYIYDVTKNHSRRWCSMTACGNRNKVTAYRQRSRATS
jgi:predicted RNA-binding Zn ribbon-like protein